MQIYTRRGDDGTTALRSGSRVGKDDPRIELLGTVDEAQAQLGLARSEAERGGPLDGSLAALEPDLWVLMSEVATAPDRRSSLQPGVTSVTGEMVAGLEAAIDGIMAKLELKSSFAVPGENRQSALLDLARTVVRRAERLAAGTDLGDSLVGAYLNRLSDLCWALAREAEGKHPVHERLPGGAGS